MNVWFTAQFTVPLTLRNVMVASNSRITTVITQRDCWQKRQGLRRRAVAAEALETELEDEAAAMTEYSGHRVN